MSRTRHDPGSLAECLHAAQGDADRFYGSGPARVWQPAFAWRPWLALGVLLGAAASAALLLWLPATPIARSAPAPVAVLAAAAPVARPSIDAPVGSGEALETRLAPLAAPAAATVPAPERVRIDPSPALPEDLNDWALDPQPTARPAEVQRLLHNTPPMPDEADATPADESAPEDESGGGPVEQAPADQPG